MYIRPIECVPYPLAGRRHHDNTQTNKPSQAWRHGLGLIYPLHNADKASTGSPIG